MAASDLSVPGLDDAPSLYRVERYDPAWGGYRNDDLTEHGLTIGRARLKAIAASNASTQPQRVVNEQTGEVYATYRRGRRWNPDA